MEYGIVFLPPATTDIRAAHEWYEKQKTNLGKEFLQMVLKQAEELKDDFINHRFFSLPGALYEIEKVSSFHFLYQRRTSEKNNDYCCFK